MEPPSPILTSPWSQPVSFSVMIITLYCSHIEKGKFLKYVTKWQIGRAHV